MKFTKLKTKLTLDDVMLVDKYFGVNIRDIEDVDYLIFLEKQGLVRFDEETTEYLAEKAGYVYLSNVNEIVFTDEEIPF